MWFGTVTDSASECYHESVTGTNDFDTYTYTTAHSNW